MTPGPWSWGFDGSLVSEPHGDTVLICREGPSDADALALAAAPDLLDALQGALKALDSIANEMTVGDRFSNAGQYLLDALEPARDAITKATGSEA